MNRPDDNPATEPKPGALMHPDDKIVLRWGDLEELHEMARHNYQGVLRLNQAVDQLVEQLAAKDRLIAQLAGEATDPDPSNN